MTFRSAMAFIERRLAKQLSALGLGVFRIAYGCILFLEVAQLFHSRHFLFDPIPYLSPRVPDLTLPLGLWLLVIACLTVGAFTRPAAIVNYAFTLMSLNRFTTHEYHHDYLMIGVNFLLVFLPVGRRLSVDRLLRTRRSLTAPPDTVSILAYEVPVFVGIALVYFDSAIYKLSPRMWMAGLGLWQPASAPYATLFDWSWLLDQEILVKGLGYLVILFEASFIFLMWIRRARVPLLVLGIGFHLGILLVFALPLFALGVTSLYLLMVPVGWWDALAARMGLAAAGAGRALIAPRPALKLAAVAIAVFLALAVFSQGLCVLGSPALARRTTLVRETHFYKEWLHAARVVLGVNPHAVFMDYRYAPRPEQVAIVYVDPKGGRTWLPVLTQRGQASVYSIGRLQVYWMHRVSDGGLRSERMGLGTGRLTAFWAHEHEVDLRDANFLIRERRLKKAEGWEPGMLHRQFEPPWVPAGTATWSDGRFSFSMVGGDGGADPTPDLPRPGYIP